MARRNTRNTKGRIISAAWKLFYQQGYESTTIEEIVEESRTSRGSFYHYFEGKDALLGTLAHIFDEKYEELLPTLDPASSALQKLQYLNRELFEMIENSISRDLLSRLLSTQLLASREKHLPEVKIEGDRVHIAVGSVAHPMTTAHLIEVIYLETEKGGLRKNLKAGDAPEAVFTIPEGDKAIAAYAFCNLHGLWKTAI